MRNLSTLVLAECIENKGRFLKKITQYLELMSVECAWTEPSHDRSLSTFSETAPRIDLGVAERCNVLAYAVDWLKDRLPASTKEKVLRLKPQRRTMRRCANVATEPSQRCLNSAGLMGMVILTTAISAVITTHSIPCQSLRLTWLF